MSRRAVIDIGTNSVKLLVADVQSGRVAPLAESSHQTRLGGGFYETHRLRPEAIERTARAVAGFVVEASKWHPERVRVVATSATRDSLNQSELLEAIRRASGMDVEVLTGECEADMVFRGVTTDPDLQERTLLILDVGGGSTESILGRGTSQFFRNSFSLGTVRLLESLQISDPPLESEWRACNDSIRRFLDKEARPLIQPKLDAFAHQPTQLIGTGGTSTILARIALRIESFDRGLVESLRLSREDVADHRERLWGLRLEERRQVPGLPPNRADVILAGAAIFSAFMAEFGFSELRVSTRGLRFAAVLDGAGE